MKTPLLAAACAALAFAQAPNTLTEQEKAAGWKLLFDGKTMQGWSRAAADAWVVEGGALKSLPKPLLREDLISAESFGDFELSFEWKVAPGANSGVKYKIQELVLADPAQLPDRKIPFEAQLAYEMKHHVSKRELVRAGGDAQVYPVAFEYQVIDDARHPDALRNPSSRAGSLYRMAAPTRAAARPVGEYNEGRIVVRGVHVEHWVNGEKVVDTTLDAPAVRQSIEARWAPGHPVRELLEKMPKPQCPVGLQHHGDTAWFRSIKIRALSSK